MVLTIEYSENFLKTLEKVLMSLYNKIKEKIIHRYCRKGEKVMGMKENNFSKDRELRSIGELFQEVYTATEKAKSEKSDEGTNAALNAMAILRESISKRRVQFL